MKYLHSILSLFLFIFLITSCSKEEKENNQVLFPAITLGDFVDIPTKLTDIIEDFDTIPLQSSDECLLGGRSNKVIKTSGYYFIGSLNEIIMFDLSGKYENKLSKLGKGPGEYSEILDFDVVDEYKEIWVSANKSIYRYSFPSMKYTGQIDLDFFANKFQYIGNGKFIAMTPDEKVFSIYSIDGDRISSYLDKDWANSGYKTVQFLNIDNMVVSQVALTNSAVCFDSHSQDFSMKDIISPDNDKILTPEINREYFNKYGDFDFIEKVDEEFTSIISFRKINGQGIMSLRYPEQELAVVIDNGKESKEYRISPIDKSKIIDDVFGKQDIIFLLGFAGCMSSDSFVFLVPHENPDLNPTILEVRKFK